MIFGYIRVSSDNQTMDSQRKVLEDFSESNHLHIDKWVEEKMSGSEEYEKRKLSNIINQMSKGDIIICTEISKLGKNLLMIISILTLCMRKEIKVWSATENYRIGNDLNSKALAYAFGLTAEIERTLISHRTKDALARKKAEGFKLGRPKSDIPYPKKLDGKEDVVIKLFNDGLNMSEIANELKVSRTTLYSHLKRKKIKIPLLKRGRRKASLSSSNAHS